jgi:2-amino-4-hydroxy-6-hydroxymethyldihydropteridine diphosphokinase
MGDPRGTFALAEARIGERIGPILARSRDHWTMPWGFTDDRLFLNRALLVRTRLTPKAVMEQALAIEQEGGRVRTPGSGYAARTLDIDLLLAEDQVIDEPGLTVPHPRLHQRYFALAPLADIVPLHLHPVLHRTVLDLLNDVRQDP